MNVCVWKDNKSHKSHKIKNPKRIKKDVSDKSDARKRKRKKGRENKYCYDFLKHLSVTFSLQPFSWNIIFKEVNSIWNFVQFEQIQKPL